ncbi:MAG: VWA domain-containing protein [Pseudomonadota bacterium]
MSEARQNLYNRIRIQKDLERFTDGVLARHDNVESAIADIAALEPNAQEFVYRWTELIGESDKELAACFVMRSASAFGALEKDGVQAWIDTAMDAFDNRGLGAGIEVFEKPQDFVERYSGQHLRCGFDEVVSFLQHFVTGLGGRELRIDTGESTYTDTDTLYLPEAISEFGALDDNSSLFKLTATHLWSQTWYGTWRYQVVEQLLRHHSLDFDLPIFNRLEAIRLQACIERDYPGLARQFSAFADNSPHASRWAEWREAAVDLLDPDADATTSLSLIEKFHDLPLPELLPFHGEMFAGKVRQALFARIEREKDALQHALRDMQDQAQGNDGGEGDEPDQEMVDFELMEDGEGGSDMSFQLSMDGETLQMPEHLQELIGSIMQDFGEMPEEHMKPADLGEYADDLLPQSGEGGDGSLDADGKDVFTYREWDCVRNRFREAFCRLKEMDVPPGEESFIEETLDKHRGILKSIKKTFEAVLGESRLLRRQLDGDDIDFDALIDAMIDREMGLEMSDYVYTRYRNVDRNIAVMFMVDMSGSTLGWVNDAERESLVLLCEALEMLKDRYAIYGFSGRTHKRCEVYRIKTFEDNYDLETKQRISGIKPKAYTRMGVAIRHLGHLLNLSRARTKLLITLSDGRPEDYGGYKGRYGIEDTRHALLELKRDGIHPFCITIDNEAQEYLPHMYGAANYAVIDEVEKLPYKVADIYRRLTT